MASKDSNDVAESNWKTKEIESGKLPPDEDTMIKHPIDLAEELSKVDKELSNKRITRSRTAAASSIEIQN